MRRPSKQRVRDAVKRDYMRGRKRLIEAIEFDNGIMALEYEVRFPDPVYEDMVTVERRLIVQSAKGNPLISTITGHLFVKPVPNLEEMND